ncbi:lysophospholipid acyltransferase family protein [candidate division KSB1 bacterium]
MKIFYLFLAKYIGPVIIKILRWTVRIEKVNSEVIDKLRSENKNFILIFWHGTMLIPLILHMKEGINVLVSTHYDGELITSLLERVGCRTVRGSSTRGGREAFKDMVSLIKGGMEVAITTDGPKGPYRKLKIGAVVLSMRTKVPMVHVSVRQNKPHSLKSWDKFLLIKPFSKSVAVYSDPINPADFKGKIEEINDQIEQLIYQQDKKAEAFFNGK